MLKLSETVAEWDVGTSDKPYQELLKGIMRLGSLRFQPYPNEENPSFIDRLRIWLSQIPEGDRKAAFLLASRILFVTQQQFKGLQRHLFERKIRFLMHLSASRRAGRSHLDFSHCADGIKAEMDRTLFVANSDSSQINEFVHANHLFFQDHGTRRLTGEPIRFWTYAARQRRLNRGDRAVISACQDYESKVLARHHKLRDKSRLVVLEDFSGTGRDLQISIRDLDAANLPFDEVVIAPVVATEKAMSRLTSECSKLTSREYRTVCSLKIPAKWQCFGGPERSYLDGGLPMQNLSAAIRKLSDWAFTQMFSKTANPPDRHGFGGLALALVFYSNCPDNSLPILWKEADDWRPLFRRVSRYL